MNYANYVHLDVNVKPETLDLLEEKPQKYLSLALGTISDRQYSIPIDFEVEIDEAILGEEEDEEAVEEQSTSSGIGKGTGVKQASASDEEDPGKGSQFSKAKMESVQAELDEYKEAVTYLKDKLHEVNLLNAKLLFTNKLFKEFTLDNSQKLKEVETFDRTQSTREIKLVYSTLAEQFSDNGSIK